MKACVVHITFAMDAILFFQYLSHFFIKAWALTYTLPHLALKSMDAILHPGTNRFAKTQNGNGGGAMECLNVFGWVSQVMGS